jgi:DNA-binding transcriptional ArsR family regulator
MDGSARFHIAGFGELVADPSRVAMLLALLDGRARPAAELARAAGVVPSTASAHLHRLRLGGLIVCERQGRHRYFRLAGERVADALETIAQTASADIAPARATPARETLARARTCYRHLAGRLGVALYATLARRGLVAATGKVATLTARGAEAFATIPETTTGKLCLDWTERRHHLGGALGVRMTEHAMAMRWLARRDDSRAVRVTAEGEAGLRRLGVDADVVHQAR